MKVVYSNYVNFLMFKCFNKSFVSIFYISFSPSVILSCDRSIATFVTSFPDRAIYNLLFQCPVTSCFLTVIQSVLTLHQCLPVLRKFPFISFNKVPQKAASTQDVNNPVSPSMCCCMKDVSFLLVSE